MSSAFDARQMQASALTKWIKSQSTLKAHLVKVCRAEELSVGGVKAELQFRLAERLKLYVREQDNEGLNRIKKAIEEAKGSTPHAGRSSQTTTTRNGSDEWYSPGESFAPFGKMGALEFKRSPFFQIQKQLGEQKTCDPVQGNHRNTVYVTINPLIYSLNKTIPSDPTSRVMIFCAHDGHGPRDIAFPVQSSLSANGIDVKANLRGLKNKPGSTRPVDVTDNLRSNIQAGKTCTVQLTYTLTQRKFYLAAYLTKITQPTDLVKKLETGKRIPKMNVIGAMMDKARDPDIQAMSTVMSLKCPLSTLRINLPCRSTACRHNQCFDALSYLQLQEQAPTWSCPICNKFAPFDTLAVDEYVLDILQNTPKSAEQVTIEPDGKWAQHMRQDGILNRNSFDSDEDDDDLVEIMPVKKTSPLTPAVNHSILARTPPGSSREASDSVPPPRSINNRPQAAVVDLTLSDDDEPPVRPPKRQYSSIGSSFDNEPIGRPTKRVDRGLEHSTPPSLTAPPYGGRAYS